MRKTNSNKDANSDLPADFSRRSEKSKQTDLKLEMCLKCIKNQELSFNNVFYLIRSQFERVCGSENCAVILCKWIVH